jgi:hypothetical protein
MNRKETISSRLVWTWQWSKVKGEGNVKGNLGLVCLSLTLGANTVVAIKNSKRRITIYI